MASKHFTSSSAQIQAQPIEKDTQKFGIHGHHHDRGKPTLLCAVIFVSKVSVIASVYFTISQICE